MMEIDSTLAIVLLAMVAFVTFTVEATVGFGSTVLAVTIGSFFLPIELVLATMIPVGIGLSVYLVARWRRAVDTRLLFRRVLPLMAIGMPFGLLLFNMKSNLWLKRGFGLFVLVLAAVELIATARGHPPVGDEIEAVSDAGMNTTAGSDSGTGDRGTEDPGTGDRGTEDSGTGPVRQIHWALRGVMLMGAGVIHGIFGSGGPMVVYVVSHDAPDKAEFRATLSALWIALNLVLVIDYVVTGLITPTTIRASALLVPPMLAGLAIGEWIHRRVNLKVFRVVVFGLLLAGGALIVIAT